MSRISFFISAGKVTPNLFSNFSDLLNNFSNVEGGKSKFKKKTVVFFFFRYIKLRMAEGITGG